MLRNAIHILVLALTATAHQLSILSMDPAQFCGMDPGSICTILAFSCGNAVRDATASNVWRGVSCGAASTWCIFHVSVNMITGPCGWKHGSQANDDKGKENNPELCVLPDGQTPLIQNESISSNLEKPLEYEPRNEILESPGL